MKKAPFLLLFLLFGQLLPAQSTTFSISGKITDCRTHGPIRNVTVKLVGSDGSQRTTMSDSAGNYVLSDCFRIHTAYVLSIHSSTAERHKDVQYGLCPYSFNDDYGYLSGDRIKIASIDSLHNEVHDFCLLKAIACGLMALPEFFFEKNSSDTDKAEWRELQNANTCMDCLVSFLMAYRTYVIEIGGMHQPMKVTRTNLQKHVHKK